MSLFKHAPKKNFFTPPNSLDEYVVDYEEELTRLRTEVYILNRILHDETDYEPPFIGPRRAPMYGPQISWQMRAQRERKIWGDIQDALMEQIKKDLIYGRGNEPTGDEFFKPPVAIKPVCEVQDSVIYKVINKRES